MLKHLRNLYSNPVLAWMEIENQHYTQNRKIIWRNLGPFILVVPVLHSIIQVFYFTSWKNLFINGFFKPMLITTSFIALFFFICILSNEIYKITSHRDPLQNVFKFFVFSSLPFFSVLGFVALPVFGKIIFLTGFVYTLYIARVGLNKFLWAYKSQRRTLFLLSTSLGIIASVAVLLPIIMKTSNWVSLFIKKLL